MKKFLFSLLAMMAVLTASAQGIYDYQVKDDAGKEVSLADYKGKVLLNIKWNFTKFLVSRDGKVLKRYEPTAKMSDIEADLQQELNNF